MEAVIDWQSQQSHILLNLARAQAHQLRLSSLPELPGHIWLATSGSSASHAELKLVALSKDAFLVSAAAVNTHLQVSQDDSWFLALPDFHVGGLSIYARASLRANAIRHWSGVGRRWNAQQFYIDLCDSRCTLVSLVPTQIWDLVESQMRAPKCLRAAVVGGGFLSPSLYGRARCLGWPLLPSYGLTECCSQVATAPPRSLLTADSPELQILSHVSAQVGGDMTLFLKSHSLLTGMATVSAQGVHFSDPRVEGWYQTQDAADVHDGYLFFRGRTDECVKINGKLVSPLALQAVLEKVLVELNRPFEACVVTMDDVRRGKRVVLAVVSDDEPSLAAIAAGFNQYVLPHEKVEKSHTVPYIPRTELGKVRINSLADMLR